MKLSEVLLYLSGFHPETVRRKAKTRKLRAFCNSIVLLVFSPLFAYAAAHGPDGNFSVASILLGLTVGLLTFAAALLTLRWSYRPDPPQEEESGRVQ